MTVTFKSGCSSSRSLKRLFQVISASDCGSFPTRVHECTKHKPHGSSRFWFPLSACVLSLFKTLIPRRGLQTSRVPGGVQANLVTLPLRPALLSARQGTRALGSGTSSLFLPELQEVLGIPVDLGGKPATTRHLSQPEGKTDPFPAPRVRVGDPTSVP